MPFSHPQIEQRIEPAKRAAHSVSKRLQACLQGHCGSEMDKRVVSAASKGVFFKPQTQRGAGAGQERGPEYVCHASAHFFSPNLGSVQKKLPLMALSMTMAESFKELDTDSSLG